MRKINHFLLGILSSLLAIGVLTGCKDDASKTISELLKTVPDDAAFVAAFDGNEIFNQLDIKLDNDNWTWGPEIENLIKETNTDKKDVKRALNMVANASKSAVIFVNDEGIWVTFKVESEEDFLKFYKEIEDEKPEKEGNIYILDSTSAMKDGQIWINTTGRCSTDHVNKFANLPEDKSFLKNNKFASEMTSGKYQASAIGNFNPIMRMARMFGSSSDIAVLQSAMALLYNDATYITFTAKTDDDGCEAIVDILNSDFKPAKCNIPTEKIDMSIFDNLKGKPALVGAVGISNDLVSKLMAAASSFGTRFSPEESNFITSIKGTAAYCFDFPVEEMSAAISFTNATAASDAANLARMISNDINVSTSGNRLIINTNNATGRGGALNDVGELKNKLAGFVLNFSSIPQKYTEGFDLASLGKVICVLEKNGDGLRLRYALKTDKPVCKIVNLISQYIKEESKRYNYDWDEEEVVEADAYADSTYYSDDTVVVADDFEDW